MSKPEGLRTRSPDVQAQEKMDGPAQAERKFTPPPPFRSIAALNGLDDVHPHWGGQYSLLKLPIQMLISSGNTLINILRNNIFYQLFEHPLVQSINHNKTQAQGSYMTGSSLQGVVSLLATAMLLACLRGLPPSLTSSRSQGNRWSLGPMDAAKTCWGERA